MANVCLQPRLNGVFSRRNREALRRDKLNNHRCSLNRERTSAYNEGNERHRVWDSFSFPSSRFLSGHRRLGQSL